MRRAYETLVLAAALGLAACDAPDKKPEVDPGQASASQQVFSLGDAVPLGIMEVRVTDAELRHAVGVGQYRDFADDSGVLVAIRYVVRNRSTGAVSDRELWPDVTLVDGTGAQYNMDKRSGAYATEFTFAYRDATSVSPGMTIHGLAVFQVAADDFNAKNWMLVFGKDGPRVSLAKAKLNVDRLADSHPPAPRDPPFVPEDSHPPAGPEDTHPPADPQTQ